MNSNLNNECILMYSPLRDYANHKDEYNNGIQTVLNHGLFVNGPEIVKLEYELSKLTNSKYCVTMSSGTDALLVALLALGVKKGDEVITVPFTWISTAEVISLIGAIPVFVDIDSSYNMDPFLIEKSITKKTAAILPVSLYGSWNNIKEIIKIGEKYNIPVIDDGAQSFGTKTDGIYNCSIPIIGCSSFFPSKPLGCYGDGGVCFTNSPEIEEKLRSIKNHGCLKRFEHNYIGINGRLDTIQASILLVKLKYFEQSIENRKNIAKKYSASFSNIKELILPDYDNDNHVFAQYTIKMNNNETRNNLFNFLKSKNISTEIFYKKCLHTQVAFNYLKYKDGDFPISEDTADTVLSIPCYPELTNKEINFIIESVLEFFK